MLSISHMIHFESIYSYIIQTRTSPVLSSLLQNPLLKNATKIQRKTDIAKKPFNLLTMSDIFFCKCKFHYMFQHHFLQQTMSSNTLLHPRGTSFSHLFQPFCHGRFQTGLRHIIACLHIDEQLWIYTQSRFDDKCKVAGHRSLAIQYLIEHSIRYSYTCSKLPL